MFSLSLSLSFFFPVWLVKQNVKAGLFSCYHYPVYMLAGDPYLDHRWFPISQTVSVELEPSPSLHPISVKNSEGKILHIHILGLPCQHHSQAAYNHSTAWSFLAPNHARQRLACQKQSTRPPRGSVSLEHPQDISEFHLRGDKPRIFSNRNKTKSYRMLIKSILQDLYTYRQKYHY